MNKKTLINTIKLNISLLENNFYMRLCPICQEKFNLPKDFLRCIPFDKNSIIRYKFGVCDCKRCLILFKKYTKRGHPDMN